MSICKDCLHNEVCKYGENRSKGIYCTGEKCKQYKPTADVVEVVRCKDCKYLAQEMIGEDLEFICKCFAGMVAPAPDLYCGIGERREDAKEI